MTYRIFSGSAKWMRIALPLFLVAAAFLFFAFKGTISAAQHEEVQSYSSMTSIELTFYGYNP